MDNEVMSLNEVADYLRITKSHLYKLLRRGSIPAAKVRRRWHLKKDNLDRWLDECMAKNLRKESQREDG